MPPQPSWVAFLLVEILGGGVKKIRFTLVAGLSARAPTRTRTHEALLKIMPSSSRKRTRAEAELVSISGGTPLPAQMIDFWRQGVKNDATVVAEGRTFEANSMALMCGSDFFRGALTSSMSEGDSSSVSLPELKAAVVEAAITFIYTGACKVDESLLPDMLSAAAYLQMGTLVVVIAAMFKERLTSGNCLDMWALAEAHTLTDLADSAKEAALRHFEAVAATEAAALMSHGRLLELLSDERLETKAEEAVFRLVVRWARAQQPPPDDNTTFELLSKVRYPLVARDVFSGEVAPELLRRGSLGARVFCAAFEASAHGPPAKRRRGMDPSRPALTWSTEYIGPGIALSEGGTLATCNRQRTGSWVRSAEPLPPTGTHLIEMEYDKLSFSACFLAGLVDASLQVASFDNLGMKSKRFWGVDDSGTMSFVQMYIGGQERKIPAAAKTRNGHVFRSGDRVGLLVDMDTRRMTIQVNGQAIPDLVFDNLPEQVFVAALPYNLGTSVELIRN